MLVPQPIALFSYVIGHPLVLVSSCFEGTKTTPLLFESTLLSIIEVASEIAFRALFVTTMPVFIFAFFIPPV